MAKKICKGDSVFIPFRNGESIRDSQLKPRMYMSRESFLNHFPGHYLGNEDVELVEYAPVVHGRWIAVPSSDMMTGKAYKCSECQKMRYGSYMPNYCQCCGAKMDKEEN